VKRIKKKIRRNQVKKYFRKYWTNIYRF
jgi:hypothetical protein